MAAPTLRWFQLWLKNTLDLHTIKTKPIALHCVNMHTEDDIRYWFKTEYAPLLNILSFTERDAKYICNIDRKSACICCPAEKEVVVPLKIKRIYVSIFKNCNSLYKMHNSSACEIVVY